MTANNPTHPLPPEQGNTPSMAGNCQRELADLLSEEALCLSRLHALLAEEQVALVERRATALDDAVKAKASALEQLARLRQQRTDLLTRNGFPDTDSGMKHCIACCSAPLARELSLVWERLHKLLESCRDQNLINGQLLERNQRILEQAIAILTGAETGVRLYTPRGMTTPSSSPRSPLARA